MPPLISMRAGDMADITCQYDDLDCGRTCRFDMDRTKRGHIVLKLLECTGHDACLWKHLSGEMRKQ